MNRFAACVAGLVLSAGLSLAGEKTIMHCFAFTPIATASQAEWDAFYKATDALPQKVKGLRRVWYGKLMRPLTQYGVNIQDPEARKKLMADMKGNADVAVTRREHGACFEFVDQAAFKAYGPDPAHKEWEAVYAKVRVPGTTTYQIIGQ
jgi:hypothetical protein